ncbi:hypothetical protein [uncultured Gammaproteobacteria bacterium]|nr:hypothetical protein [uncultured Gammaproteobacteria bacterium]CAC9999535.1 hypothetical protein [uncultured Gammaproteobacteria bacterium]VVH55932.1 hypothetical protein BAZOLSSOX_1411 [uncultured Gammaproteobacteria bacterium]
MFTLFLVQWIVIHHHTGGLENYLKNHRERVAIHHHTGGLEKQEVDF